MISNTCLIRCGRPHPTAGRLNQLMTAASSHLPIPLHEVTRAASNRQVLQGTKNAYREDIKGYAHSSRCLPSRQQGISSHKQMPETVKTAPVFVPVNNQSLNKAARGALIPNSCCTVTWGIHEIITVPSRGKPRFLPKQVGHDLSSHGKALMDGIWSADADLQCRCLANR